MNRIFVSKIPQHINEQVMVAGWIHIRRDHGGLVFFDLRDRSGLLQVIFRPEAKEAYEQAQKVRPEWVVEIVGTVKERPKGMANPDLETGSVELAGEELKVLNEAKTPPFELTLSDEKFAQVDEELRLTFRYLDLRRFAMRQHLKLRHRVVQLMRNFLSDRDFIEIETPILTRSTPEGARDYIVPSRVHKGRFFALPQSPQQYKQLLMVAGFERYFQIARCFRDEDTRGDRQPEFTQLDLEMSFVTQEDILQLTEELFVKIVEELTDRHLTFKPFKRLSYKEVTEQYGTDSPDLREDKNDPKELAFAWIVDWPLFEWNRDEKRHDPMHHIFTAPRDEDIPLLDSEPLKVRSWQHDLVCNGYEIGGGSLRIHRRDIQEKIFSLVGISKKEAQEKFGHLLRAFEYGAPPHGGIAPGIDRLLMILSGTPNIREVIAFPKTGDAQDPMMKTPAEVSEEQLRELGITIRKRKGQ